MADSKEVTKNEFFGSGRNREVYQKLISGMTINEICDALNMKRHTIMRALQNSEMISALEEYLNLRLFDLDLKKVDAKVMAFDLLQKEFKTRLSDASPDTIVREFTKMLSSTGNYKIILGDLVNILVAALPKDKPKTPEETVKNLEKDFGYQPLILPADESNNRTKEDSSNPSLDKKESVTD